MIPLRGPGHCACRGRCGLYVDDRTVCLSSPVVDRGVLKFFRGSSWHQVAVREEHALPATQTYQTSESDPTQRPQQPPGVVDGYFQRLAACSGLRAIPSGSHEMPEPPTSSADGVLRQLGLRSAQKRQHG